MVSVSTSGLDPGVGTYSVLIDEGAGYLAQQIPTNGELFIPAAQGSHSVRLYAIPRHCRVPTNNPLTGGLGWLEARQTVTVGARAATARFSIVCLPVGTLRIEVHTTGWKQASQLHIGFLDKDPRWLLELPLNGTMSLEYVSAEPHSVGLALAPGCRGPTRRTVSVVPNAAVTVRFDVICD
jgi:hypothetical protein